MPLHWICTDKAHNFGLNEAETSVLERLYLRDNDIATDLGISDKDVNLNIECLLNKFGVSTRLGIITQASILGIVGLSPPPDDNARPLEGAAVPRKPYPNDGASSIALPPPLSNEDT